MEDNPSLSHDRKRPFIAITVGVSLSLIFSLFLIFHHKHPGAVDPAFSKYMESYTSGIVSKEGTIRIRLAGPLPSTQTFGP